MRWRVERAGTREHYTSGWFARNEWTEQAAWFPTWRGALNFAVTRAQGNLRSQMPAVLARWGVESTRV